MVEIFLREQWTKLAEWEMTEVTRGVLGGQKPEAVQKIVKLMRGKLEKYYFHTIHDSRTLRAELQSEIREIRATTNQLKRLEAMTVE